MKEFTKSLFSFGLAVSFFGLKQVENILLGSSERKGPAKSLDHVTAATTAELSGTLESTFRATDNLQRGIVGLVFGLIPFGSTEESKTDSGAAEPRKWVDVMEGPPGRL